MRLRLLVPRGGRGRGLGGLALAAVAAALVVVLAQDGEETSAPPPPAAPTRIPTPTPTPTATPVPRFEQAASGPSLAVGLTEPNPNLFAPNEVLEPPPPWARWRNQLVRIRPDLYRLVVVWSHVQPAAEAPPDLGTPASGCMRDKQPCAPWTGVLDQLRALAARQREGGWETLLVFTSTPAWAVAAPRGCREQAGAGAPENLAAYRALVRAVLDLADEVGARVRYVSPWNEPNHPYFLSPQRGVCDASAPSTATKPYVALARAARRELRTGQQLVLGELAGILEPTSRATSVGEMIGALPRPLVCSAPVWSQHAYIGGTDPVATVKQALAGRRCAREHAIWITETGVGPAPGGLSLARGITSERQGCRLLHERLRQWHSDPQVTLAAQYTMREDDLFPTGLVTTDLARARPALREWQAWGARERPEARAPSRAC
jgi:hypothetical protein